MLIKVDGKKGKKTPGARGIATQQQEAAFDHWAEESFKSQREMPNGRNFLWNSYCWKEKKDLDNYRKNFDAIFGPKTPGYGI